MHQRRGEFRAREVATFGGGRRGVKARLAARAAKSHSWNLLTKCSSWAGAGTTSGLCYRGGRGGRGDHTLKDAKQNCLQCLSLRPLHPPRLIATIPTVAQRPATARVLAERMS